MNALVEATNINTRSRKVTYHGYFESVVRQAIILRACTFKAVYIFIKGFSTNKKNNNNKKYLYSEL